jgi:hypothetical protein
MRVRVQNGMAGVPARLNQWSSGISTATGLEERPRAGLYDLAHQNLFLRTKYNRNIQEIHAFDVAF